MIEQLQELVNAKPALVRRGQWLNAIMLLGIGEANWWITIRAGRIDAIKREDWAVSSFDFALKGTEDGWAKFWTDPPPPRHHDISALVREGKMRLEGDIDMLQANFLYLKLVLEQLRGRI